MRDHLVGYENVIGEWREELPTVSGLPISNDQYMEQMRINFYRKHIPLVKYAPEHEKIFVMICGGPSAKKYIPEIREKALNTDVYHVYCSNKTLSWLTENGIEPYGFFIIDPKEGKIKDLDCRLPDRTRYYLGMQCHPSLFDRLDGYRNLTGIVVACGIKNSLGISDIQLAATFRNPDEFAYLFGGSMAGLRAMNLADIMGYRTVEFYGFDSCFFEFDENGEPKHYSYDKPRAEDILEVETPSGRRWFTTPVFASQARQYIKWKHRLEWMKFVIHGDSFTKDMDEIDNEQSRPKTKDRFTIMHKERNEELFKKDPSYGSVGESFAGEVCMVVAKILRKFSSCSMLDYGCGTGRLIKALPPINGLTVAGYDPFVQEYSSEPRPADLVTCFDVLEHVEPECLENVLDHLAELTQKVLFVSIATVPAAKYYRDGLNAHMIVEDYPFWYAKLRKRFIVAKKRVEPGRVIFLAQKRGIDAT